MTYTMTTKVAEVGALIVKADDLTAIAGVALTRPGEVIECLVCGALAELNKVRVCRRCGTVVCRTCEGKTDPTLCTPCDQEEVKDLFLEVLQVHSRFFAGFPA